MITARPFSHNEHRKGHSALFADELSEEDKTPPPTALEEKQALLAHHVRLVARKISHGLFVAGQGGLGKSRTISQTLAEEGISPVLVNSHITPLSLYTTLFHNRLDACIWLDDCDSIFQSTAILGILRSALWGQKEGRVVTYTSTQLGNIPNRFVFEGQIIFCANTFPKRNEAFKAVLSRVDVFELSATNDEVLELMRTMAENGYGKLSPKRCLQVVEFIAKAGGTRQLSMRMYEPSMKKVEYALKNRVPWRDLVRSQLDQIGISEGVAEPLNSKAHDFTVMAQAIAAHESVKLQEEFWCKATGKSRASFFRTKKQYDAEQK
ncbi:MAG: hypothetical protein K2X38_02145 [Gemmataceae bacterium]|nr:hypothetical protein [Gemmataceae bacterium]